MENCLLCPRKCGIDRSRSVGFCAQTNEIRIARAALHMWEEPVLSGERGSGTVFFCGCTLGCVYCQNAAISRQHSVRGRTVTTEELAQIFLDLQSQRAHNINLVTPTMFLAQISEAIGIARSHGLTLPIVYNTSGYERPEMLSLYGGMIDIYLPDFKYLSPDLAKKYSGAENYPQYAKSSLAYMVNRIGDMVYDENGMMRRGVIVRHLLLPGQLAESKQVLAYLFAEYGNSITYSLMSQYTPTSSLDRARFPELSRRVTTYEYRKLVDYALSLGITNGFTQDGKSARESFIPDFE